MTADIYDIGSEEGQTAWARAMRLLSARIGIPSDAKHSDLYDKELKELDSLEPREVLFLLAAMTEIANTLLLASRFVEIDDDGEVHGRQRALDLVDDFYENELEKRDGF
jgi:hypothetical protein